MIDPKSQRPRKWTRLSATLKCERHPLRCQACGAAAGADLVLWQECDDSDQPGPVHLVLCMRCSDRLIEKHPRLYHDIRPNAPVPGAMVQCAECRHRLGLDCQHPRLRSNGGAGLLITSSQPTIMHMDGTTKGGRRRGWTELVYAHPPRCSGLNAGGEGPGASTAAIADPSQNQESREEPP